MGGISRAGNERLRVLLVIGATSVIKAAVRPGSKQMMDWLRAPLATQAAQGRRRGARQQDGSRGLGADDAWKRVPASDRRRRSGRGMTAVIRFAAKRHVTIGGRPKPPLRAIVELDLSELQAVKPPRG